jgi:hypothetical protein
MWLMLEGGLMKFLAKGATDKIVEDAAEKRESLIKTFQEHLHNKYNAYAAWFLCCEQLNFTVVLSQWFVTNKFLKYKFLRYVQLTYYSSAHSLRALAMRTRYAHSLHALATRTRYAHSLRALATRTRYAHVQHALATRTRTYQEVSPINTNCF